MRFRVFAAVVASLSLTAGIAGAQSANATASANVQQPITVTKTRDLGFGNVFPGVDKTIAVSDATSATFSVTGQASTQVHITFTLPTVLENGAEELVISNWTGYYNTTSSTTGGSSFTPSASATTATLSSGDGELFVFVGATVEPTSTQEAGSYTGTVTMTVVYF